jgi:hypothetical protein
MEDARSDEEGNVVQEGEELNMDEAIDSGDELESSEDDALDNIPLQRVRDANEKEWFTLHDCLTVNSVAAVPGVEMVGEKAVETIYLVIITDVRRFNHGHGYVTCNYLLPVEEEVGEWKISDVHVDLKMFEDVRSGASADCLASCNILAFVSWEVGGVESEEWREGANMTQAEWDTLKNMLAENEKYIE